MLGSAVQRCPEKCFAAALQLQPAACQGGMTKGGNADHFRHTTDTAPATQSVLEANDLNELMTMVGAAVGPRHWLLSSRGASALALEQQCTKAKSCVSPAL